MTTMPLWSVRFVNRLVAGRYTVKMPDFLAAHERWDVWEHKRFLHMESNLMKHDVLFDIGAETGEMSAIYAQFVKPENMVLIESYSENWQNIRATWEENGLCAPQSSVCALIGNTTTSVSIFPIYSTGWPAFACTDQLWIDRSYRYLHEHAYQIPCMKLDDFYAITKIIPNAFTIDVEGAEYEVLLGAKKLLRDHKLKVWVSIHPDLMEKNYKTKLEHIIGLMDGLGYEGICLDVSNEHHYFFQKRAS